jgi:hypothetical protein
MPKWKEGAKEFTVSVGHTEVRGYSATLPMPIVERLSYPKKITFVVRRGMIEVRAAEG